MRRFKEKFHLAAILAVINVHGALAQSEELAAAAKKEGALSIYSATDLSQVQPLLNAFARKYPGIRIDYNDVGTNGVYNRVISEAAAKQVGGDLIWTSGVDQAVKLATDGYLAQYESSESASLPSWAVFDKQVYATTLEPIGIIYNKTILPEEQVPQTRADLAALIAKPEFKGKIGTFDPEKSGVGFMIQTYDFKQRDDYWTLMKAFGAAQGKTYAATGTMRETVVSGENAIAFNVIGSYALDWVKTSPNLGVAFTKDYSTAFSRAAALVKDGPHPNAAKLFLDFMLSKEGQDFLASQGMPSLRDDVESGLNIKTLNELVGGNLQPMPLDTSRLEFMEPVRRLEFLKKWHSAVKG